MVVSDSCNNHFVIALANLYQNSKSAQRLKKICDPCDKAFPVPSDNLNEVDYFCLIKFGTGNAKKGLFPAAGHEGILC